MTATQNRIFEIIKKFIKDHHYAPSLTELCRICGLRSLSTMHKHLSNLKRDGYITFDYNRARSIALCPEPMHGYHRCNKGHEEIFFRAVDCPICAIVSNFGRQIEIRKQV